MKKLILIAGALLISSSSCTYAWSSAVEVAEKHARCAAIFNKMEGVGDLGFKHLKTALEILDQDEVMYQAGFANGIMAMMHQMNQKPINRIAANLYLETCASTEFWK